MIVRNFFYVFSYLHVKLTFTNKVLKPTCCIFDLDHDSYVYIVVYPKCQISASYQPIVLSRRA